MGRAPGPDHARARRRVARQARAARCRSPRRDAAPPSAKASEELVRCAHCGLLLPRGEAPAGGRRHLLQRRARPPRPRTLMQPVRYPELFLAPPERTPDSFWISLGYFNLYRIAVATLFLALSVVYKDALNLGSHDLALFRARAPPISSAPSSSTCRCGACARRSTCSFRSTSASTSSPSRSSCTRAAACAAASA